MSGQVFISYVREDSAAVDKLQRTLEEAGIGVWRDVKDLPLGTNWHREIQRQITRKALVFVACFSEAALRRTTTYQRQELAWARQVYGQRSWDRPWLIPVRLDDCELADVELGNGETFESLNWLDLFGDGWDTGCSRLVDEVRRLLPETGAVQREGSDDDDRGPRAGEPPPSGPDRAATGSGDGTPAAGKRRPWSSVRRPQETHRFVLGTSIVCGLVGFLLYRGLGFGFYVLVDDLAGGLLPSVDPTGTPRAAVVGALVGLTAYAATAVAERATPLVAQVVGPGGALRRGAGSPTDTPTTTSEA